jgi:sugar lactone lactonase YvrE
MRTAAAALFMGITIGSAIAQQPAAPAGAQPYTVGNRLGMPINPAPDGAFTPMSSNVKVYGTIYSAESCSYDATRGVIVVPNRGVGQNVQTNNAWMQTGAPAGETRVEKSNGFNDIEVADDRTIYATQTGVGGQTPDPTTWQVWKITKDGTASIFVQGAPLRQPNGIAIDEKGNIVVVNIGNNEVLTLSQDARLLKTDPPCPSGWQ